MTKVIVIGGGSAGIAAAVGARKAGAEGITAGKTGSTSGHRTHRWQHGCGRQVSTPPGDPGDGCS